MNTNYLPDIPEDDPKLLRPDVFPNTTAPFAVRTNLKKDDDLSKTNTELQDDDPCSYKSPIDISDSYNNIRNAAEDNLSINKPQKDSTKATDEISQININLDYDKPDFSREAVSSFIGNFPKAFKIQRPAFSRISLPFPESYSENKPHASDVKRHYSYSDNIQKNEQSTPLGQPNPIQINEFLLKHSAFDIFKQVPASLDDLPQQFRKSIFSGLKSVLKKHYHNIYINEEDLNISEPELKILKAILSRKYNYKALYLYPAKDLLNTLHKIDICRSSKRLEENYKFVLSRCIKYLKKQLPQAKSRKIGKKEFDHYFYQFYFGDLCKDNNASLEEFQLAKCSNSFVFKTKTISEDYIAGLARSRLFTKECLKYMNHQLHVDYIIEMDSKIGKLVEGWEKAYLASNCKPKFLEDVVQNILKSQRFKLPWVKVEVETAIESIRSIFNKYVPEF